MTIDIVPATPEDAPTIVPIGLLAFSKEPLNRAIEKYADLTPEQRSEHLQWRIGRNKLRMTGPGKHWFKAIDSETGNVVGYTGASAPEKEGQPKTTISVIEHLTEAPASIDRELAAVAELELAEVKGRNVGDRNDLWYVQSMAVDPAYQRQGIAKRLLLKVVELADEAGQDMYLESTPEAKKLYQSVGFEVLEEFAVKGQFPMTSYLRKAKAKA